MLEGLVGDAEPRYPKKGMLIKAEAKKWGQLIKEPWSSG